MLNPSKCLFSLVAGLFCIATYIAAADVPLWKLHNLEGTQELRKGQYSEAKGLFEAALAELDQSGGERVGRGDHSEQPRHVV